MQSNMILSIIIVNWNTKDFLISCLESIQKYPPKSQFEVIVVDNNSSDKSVEYLNLRFNSTSFPQLKIILTKKNIGYADGNNIAFEQAQGQYLLTLNPDTVVNDNCLQSGIDYLETHPEVGSIGIKQVGVNGNIQRSVRGFPTVLGVIGDSTGLSSIFPLGKLGSYRLHSFDYTLEQVAPQPMGTFLMLRRKALEAIGNALHPFDSQFPIFFNEVDLLKRLDEAGWKCYYVPSISIIHYGGESTKQVRKLAIWESHYSLLRYWKKHSKGIVEKTAIVAITPLVLIAALIRARGYSRGFRA